MRPPTGRNALRTARSDGRSTEDVGATEEVDVEGDGIELLREPFVGRKASKGNAEGRVDTVAAVRCWLDVRKHALRMLIRASASGIYDRMGELLRQ